MKKLIFIILIALSFVSVPAQTDSAALQEAVKVSTQVVKLFSEKKYDEALPLAKKVVSIREKELGKKHLLVAQALRNLAFVQIQLNQRKEAEESFKKAFEIYEKSPTLSAADEKIYAGLLETVAIFEAGDTDITGAEKKLKRAVEIYEKVSGKDSLDAADALFKLAQLYEVKGDYEQAAPLLLRSLDIKSAKLGIKSSQTNDVYSTTYCTLNKLERKEEADKLREKFYPQPVEAVGETERVITGTSKISGGVVNSKATNLVKPVYPYAAREKRASGAVNVQVTIDENGDVIYACALSGAKELQRTSEIAAYQSKFAPTLLLGKPVKVTGVIIYNYVP